MAEHTPGPWEWVDNGESPWLWGAHGKRPIVLDCGRVRGRDDFEIRGRDNARDLMVRLDIRSPNARLIATAPDLLAACKAVESQLLKDAEGHCPSWIERMRPLYDMVRAAIARAEGEALGEGDSG